jgi:hypothetical protein
VSVAAGVRLSFDLERRQQFTQVDRRAQRRSANARDCSPTSASRVADRTRLMSISFG